MNDLNKWQNSYKSLIISLNYKKKYTNLSIEISRKYAYVFQKKKEKENTIANNEKNIFL